MGFEMRKKGKYEGAGEFMKRSTGRSTSSIKESTKEDEKVCR